MGALKPCSLMDAILRTVDVAVSYSYMIIVSEHKIEVLCKRQAACKIMFLLLNDASVIMYADICCIINNFDHQISRKYSCLYVMGDI